jgi:hypothetical protein
MIYGSRGEYYLVCQEKEKGKGKGQGKGRDIPLIIYSFYLYWITNTDNLTKMIDNLEN